MEFPKDVICLISDWVVNPKPGLYIKTLGPHPIKDQVYIATGIIENIAYTIQGFKDGYEIRCFRDLDDINIKEITEILKEEPCLI